MAEPITIADGAIIGLIYNVAIRLLSSYDITPNAQLGANARDGIDAMRHLAVTIAPTSFPCTLPIGSGNEQENTFNNQHFYACPDDELLTEREGSILLESNTHES